MKEELRKIIEKQIELNILNNVYDKPLETMEISLEMKKLIIQLRKQVFTKDEIEELIKLSVTSFINKLYENNQYLQFDEKQKRELSYFYKLLYLDLIQQDMIFDEVRLKHYQRISSFLIKNNPLYSLLDQHNKQIKTYVCEEYSAFFQLALLKIAEMKEPILDIGCGLNGNLVRDLRKKGYLAYGIDRVCSDEDYFEQVSWLDYDYGKDKWETIISNMAFSNHFNHLYLLQKDVELYTKKYHQILAALQIGGCFYYAPALPFVEKILDESKYEVQHEVISVSFERTKIMRFK